MNRNLVTSHFIFCCFFAAAESSKLQEKVDLAESKLQQMMETIAEKERALAAKEQAVSDVKLETDAVIEQLKVRKMHKRLNTTLVRVGKQNRD